MWRENADDASFCQNCGQSLRTGSTPEERKLVSILFVDIVGSTASADRADPEDVRDRLGLFFEAVREQVERYVRSPTARWRIRSALGSARYATGDDAGAESAYREAAEVIRAYAATLTDEHAAGFLDAEPVREALAGGAG